MRALLCAKLKQLQLSMKTIWLIVCWYWTTNFQIINQWLYLLMVRNQLIDFSNVVNVGTINDDLNFSYGNDATAYKGCTVSLKGELWYFGGKADTLNQTYQVSLKIITIYIFGRIFILILGEQNYRLQIATTIRFAVWIFNGCMQYFWGTRRKSFVVFRCSWSR